jgi:hypothetical protein
MSEKQIQKTPSEESLAALRSMFPKEAGFERRSFSRLALTSQDKTEGKGKSMKVIAEAGMFYIETPSDELDEVTGKKKWIKNELGTSIEGIIVFNRKQLSFYNSADESYTSSPIYDNDDEVIPLFCSGAEIAKGTPKELQALYPAQTRTGKSSSALKDNVIMYVLYEDELYQMNLHGSSMYAYKTFKRSTRPGVNEYLVRFSSEPKTMGSTEWNQITFSTVRPLNADEVEKTVVLATDLITAISEEKEFFANRNAAKVEFDTFNDDELPALT